MDKSEVWLKWAVELQSIAQAGLFYGRDPFDMERYERVREIAAEMISYKGDISLEKVKDLFCGDVGYQTPKIDTRAAIFKGDRILLVKENNGTWSLPGGWVDVGLSVSENVVKEVKEEAGLDVRAERVIAVQDREKHNRPLYAYKVCKIFVLCSAAGGTFEKNIETVGNCLLWRRRKILRSRCACVLRHMGGRTGLRCWIRGGRILYKWGKYFKYGVLVGRKG